MDDKLQRRIQRYGWDAAAKIYDTVWRENLAPAHDAMLELAEIAPGNRVLEVAAGSGFLTFRAAEAVGAEGRILATDISAEMVKLLQAHAESLGLDHVSAERREAENLDMPGAGFDVALCALGLMFVTEPVAALKQMHDALGPDGRLIAAVWGERRKCGWAEIFPIIDSVVHSEVCPLFFSLGAGDSLRSAMEQAGLSDIRVRRIEFTLHFDSPQDALVAQLDGGAVALAAKRFNAASRAGVEKAFLDSISAFENADHSYAIPGEFVIAGGKAG